MAVLQQTELIKTLFLYCLNECCVGSATHLDISIKGQVFRITDNGRGHSLGKEVEGISYLELAYQQPEALLKANSIPPIQIHTLGLSLLNKLSPELSVEIRRAGALVTLNYVEGNLESTNHSSCPLDQSGNSIQLKLDEPLLEESIQQLAAYFESMVAKVDHTTLSLVLD